MSLQQLVKDWDPLLEKLLPGSSPLHRAAIWGQMGQESNAKPDAVEKPGTNEGGIGLLQWTGPRRTALVGFAATLGQTWRDIATQVRFIAHELLGPEAHAWKQTQLTTSPEAAAETFMLDYERPAPATANLQRRINDTYTALAAIQTAQPGATTVVDNPPVPIPPISDTPPVTQPSTDPTANWLAELVIKNEVQVESVLKGLLVAKGMSGFLVDIAFSALNPVINNAVQNIHPDDIAKGIVSLIGQFIQNAQKKSA
jgi:hypothetical protein